MQLTPDLVFIGKNPTNKIEAITSLSQQLSDMGKIQAEYLQAFLQRESIENTYLGKGIAIPHGVPESRNLINETSIAVMQIPEGVVWGDDGETVRLIVAIAAQGSEHLQILRKLTRLFRDQKTLELLFTTNNPAIICNALNDEKIEVESYDVSQNQTFKYSQTVILPNPQGMHARPASTLLKLVQSFDAPVILQTTDGKQVDASKMFDVLGMGLTKDSEIKVLSNDEQATHQIASAITLGLGDDLTVITSHVEATSGEHLWQPQGDITTLKGVGASDGLVIGKIFHYGQKDYDIPTTSGSVLEETTAIDSALQQANKNLHELMSDSNVGTEEQAIFEAHLAILNDLDLIKETVSFIRKGDNAPRAYKKVSDQRIEALSAVDNAHIAARASDVLDVQNRVMNALLGLTTQEITHDQPVILCAQDLTPSDTMKLSPDSVLGFVTEVGGPTGHSAIIARNMGLPAIVAVGSSLSDIANDTQIIMDGTAGVIYLNPNAEQLASAQQAQQKLLEKRKKSLVYRTKKGQTKDGHLVEISANTNEAEDVSKAIEFGAEGVGLMRTELLYLSCSSIPSEDYQYQKYVAMAKALGDKPLIIRTLDIGGDKEVDYLGLVREDNAFLGIRGIRLCFERPDLFMPQLRAICRVAKEYNNVHVMFPMIGKLSDWHRAKDMLENVRQQLGAPKFPVGIMVEVPSAALMAPQFAEHVDFFSIGTNDLTQYTLAMDRMHPILASQTDAMHPAVLRLIDITVKAGQAHGKWVGVCGNAAGEVASAKILVGLGVTELSMSPIQIAGVKQALDNYDYSSLQTLANEALAQESAIEVRRLLAKH